MKPARFDYERPTTVEDALALLGDGSDETRVMAGGQSLMPMLAMRLSRPERLVDINGIAELQGVKLHDGVIDIGAGTRQRSVERADVVVRELPILIDALQLVGHPTIRNRGTFGGSLAHADPAAELPAVAVALGAEFVIRSTRGTRVEAAQDFLIGHFTSSLEVDELLVAVRFPLSSVPRYMAIEEYSRRSGDFAVAGAVCALDVDSGRVHNARVVGIGVDAHPRRCGLAEELVNGADLGDQSVIDAACAALADDCNPSDDVHGSASYRRRIVAETLRRALAKCWNSAKQNAAIEEEAN